MGRRLSSMLIVLCGSGLANAAAWAETANRGPGLVTSIDRFSGRIQAGERPAAALAARDRGSVLHYQVLSIAPGTRTAASPPPNSNMLALPLKARGGFVVYELRGGKLTTIIDGRRQVRRTGEFWIVRPGEDITFESEDDSVVLQTIQIPGP